MTVTCGRAAYALALGGICLAHLEAAPRRDSQAIITGYVRLLRTDGNAAASVDVWASDSVSGAEVGRDQTDRDGHFTLSVPPGRYTVSAARHGFVQASYGSMRDGLPASPLIAGVSDHIEIQFVIRRAAIVTGVVRTENGSPVPGASVEFLRLSSAGGAAWNRTVTRSTTDASGTYRAEALPPGRYVAACTVTPPISSGDDTARVLSPASQFFPGTNDEAQAVELTLAADDERTGVDFILVRQPLTNVTGVLVPPERVRILDDFQAVVTGVDGAPPLWATPRILAAGTFVLSLHPGRYRIDIRAVGVDVEPPQQRNGRLFHSSVVVDVPKGPSLKREFPLRESLRVSGRLRALGSEIISESINDVRVRLVPASSRQPAVRPVEAASIGNGRFSADGIAPGAYLVELVDAAGTWELEDVQFKGSSRPELTIDIDDHINVDDLELIVAPITASLSGLVVWAPESVSSYVLALAPQDVTRQAAGAWRARPGLTRADGKGGYLFSRQRPGSYLLFMLKNPDPADLENATFLDYLHKESALGIPVTLKSGSETKLDLRMR